MRILVISDSHKRTGVIDKILSVQQSAKYVFFLGDNVDDLEDFEILYPDKIFFKVCGNCDYFSTAPTVGFEVLNGVRIFYTHGHTFNVKSGTERLLQKAREENYNIVLYGHTHIAKTLYADGIHIVNPGSCSSPREGKPSYAVIDITESGAH